MIHLAIPNLAGNERKYLNECIDSTFVSSVGPFVDRFEEDCKRACGSKFAVATSSGTTGLHIALMAVGVGRDDLVILPSFTFIASANVIAHCGATPWLFDIDENWVIDISSIEEALDTECITKDDKVFHKETGRRIAAIMPVYTLGNIPDMLHIRDIAQRFNLPVVADAACAIGASLKGKLIGNLADLSVFSFNGNKTITSGGGGMVVGDSKGLLDLVRHLTTTARASKEYDFDMVGFNYRMTNIQAAVGCAQIEQLESFLERKRYIRRCYKNRLSDIRDIKFFPESDGSSCWFSGIVLDEKNGIDGTRSVCERLSRKGIEARSFWKPIHLQKPYLDAPVYKKEKTEKLWNRIITLPCSTGITDRELETVSEAVRTVLSTE